MSWFRQEEISIGIAALLVVSRQTVISIELEKYDPRLPLAFKIADVLDKSIVSIFEPVKVQKYRRWISVLIKPHTKPQPVPANIR